MQPLSLCMIVKNEESMIEQAIRSVLPIVDDVVVVDTGSIDQTSAIARSLGARIFNYQWKNDFAAARNFSIEKARGSWILVLDADEAVDQSQHQLIRELISIPKVGWSVVQRHYTDDVTAMGFAVCRGEFPQWERSHGGYFESSLVRLFPRHKKIRYRGRVHELVEHSLKEMRGFGIGSCGLRLHHYGHTAAVLSVKQKRELYFKLGTQKIREHPKDWKSFYELGVELFSAGRYQEAIDALEQSMKLNDRYHQAHICLSNCYRKMNNFGKAAAAMVKAAELSPGSREIWNNLGGVYYSFGRYHLAEAAFARALRIDPVFPSCMLNLAKVFYRLHKDKQAEVVSREVLKVMPSNESAALFLADLLHHQQRKEEVLSVLMEAVEVIPNSSALALRCGLTFKNAGQLESAERHLSHFLSLEQSALEEPDNSWRKKRYQLALKARDQVRTIHENLPS